MFKHVCNTHTITLAVPVEQCHMLFTPAGEELWIEHWHPTYIHPESGRTEAGMVFTTGDGDDYTIWSMVDFDRERHYSRYARVTPALRTGFVEVCCEAVSPDETRVTVSYALTALTPKGNESLVAYEGDAFREMIEEWGRFITHRLPGLLTAEIR